jgi:outer membrane protein assembly factor BamE (lipoprotein component of BamABCDE complex)
MLQKRFLIVFALIMVASMLLAACGTAATAEPQVIVQTQVVEVEKVITPTPGVLHDPAPDSERP